MVKKGGGFLGVITTGKWIKEANGDPLAVCENLVNYFPNVSKEEIHSFLTEYGMPRFRMDGSWMEKAKEAKLWKKTNDYFLQLKRNWNGPDVPIFIFPVEEGRGLFMRTFDRRSGISFNDKMFLFLSPEVEDEELMALLVHEYHHVCRLQKNEEQDEHLTLIDAIIMEGLAEHAVLNKVGEQHVTEWCKKYPKRQLKSWWKRLVAPHQHAKQDEPIFNQLLSGKGFYPPMLGYAIGYDIVDDYYKKNSFSIKDSFQLPAKTFVELYEAEE